VDNAGARKVLNSLSARYLVPLLDLGVEIIPNEGGYEAVGQVRAVIPGRSGCLFCTGDIDPSEAALDLLSEEERRERAQRGYVRGTDLTPVPSVLHLNGVVSHLAVSQFLRLVFGESLEGKEFLHYDRQECSLLGVRVAPNPECPVCGNLGYLGAGDEVPQPRGGAPGGTLRTRRLSKGAWVDKEESPGQSQDVEGQAPPEPEPNQEKGEEPDGC
jgi:hypothetical protein